MTKRQDLYLQRRSRSEQSDQRQPNQAKNISHQPRASPNSTPLTSRIEFPTMTPESPAIARMPDQRDCTGKPLCQPSQPPHEYGPGIRPKDATDREARTPRSRGRSVV